MALIKCPECGKEISDQSNQCIHCGYPLKNNICRINEIEYDLNDELGRILQNKEEAIKAIGSIRRKTSLTLSDAKKLVDLMSETKSVPKMFNSKFPLEDREKLYGSSNSKIKIQESVSSSKPIVVCPYCQSSNVMKIGGLTKVIDVAVFGIFGTKRFKQWHCNNCKSDF